ncbi:MAG: hypothetical protein FWB83_05700 [Treponema sp.]|nr:hypothetical protein [Treponema sp.]MCL2245432.1 hypothetical protein [Treponema sp.]
MNKNIFFTIIFVFVSNIFAVYAQDMIILRDGSIIEAKVTELSNSEIRYLRFNHLDGPVIVIPRNNVLSIRYENGTVEIISSVPSVSQDNVQADPPQQRPDRQPPARPGTPSSPAASAPASAAVPAVPVLGEANLLQQALNRLPAVAVAGNNLNFTFGGDVWIAMLNGRNFLAGTITMEETDEGVMLSLRQTHVYPPRDLPGISWWIRTPGPVINLEYKIGPPASLSFVSSSRDSNERESGRDNRQAQQNVRQDNSNTENLAGFKFSMGAVFGIASLEDTMTYTYMNGTTFTYTDSGTYFEIMPLFNFRFLFSSSSNFYYGFGFEMAFSPVLFSITGDFGLPMDGIIAPYGIIGGNNFHFHFGYDFAFGGFYISPVYIVNNHFLIGIHLVVLASTNNISISSSMVSDNQNYKMNSYKFGVSLQYVF